MPYAWYVDYVTICGVSIRGAGTWIPMILLRPNGDLPCIQVSIPQTLNSAEDSLKYGRVLESFRHEGYCILGNGSSYHNFAAIILSIMGVPGAPLIPDNRPFENELKRAATKLKGKREWNLRLIREINFLTTKLSSQWGRTSISCHFLVSIGAAGADQGMKLGEWDLFGTTMTSNVW